MTDVESLVRSGRLLEGRTVVVSGAGRARGIGKATARLFVEHGARVAMLDLDEAEVREAAADVAAGSAATLAVRCDVTRMESCRSAIEQVLEWSGSAGRIDVLVNNAGVTQKRPVAEITPDGLHADHRRDAARHDAARAGGHSGHARAAARAASSTSRRCRRCRAAASTAVPTTCAAKAGVLGLTRALARELGPDGIRANAITPGLIVTDFSRSGTPDEAKHAMGQAWPLQRAGSPVEIGCACLFLASDLSSYVTGITLDVNGGAYMR
jgi:NAD(P)-dependent dehydrogenase (short-subunit alcohol dehydrogenase family)